METNKIPDGWWLNVTLMADKYDPSWIVGVIREGKASWITEGVKGDLKCPEDAYDWGMDWIRRYKEKADEKRNNLKQKETT